MRRDEKGIPPNRVNQPETVLLASRIIHPFGLKVETMATIPRAVGAGGTALVILASLVTLLWQFFRW